MASFVLASECRCQNCQKLFHLNNQKILTVINLDIANFGEQSFTNGNLNKVRCDKCNTEFTFETKMVVFSYIHKFAIYVNPYSGFDGCSQTIAPRCLFPDDFIFREVNYYIEAREKVNIFRDGLSDAAVEKFKYENFENHRTTSFDEYNIIYTSHTGNRYIFEVCDCNDIMIDTYSFSDDADLKSTPPCIDNSLYWTKINKLTIKELCKGELV